MSQRRWRSCARPATCVAARGHSTPPPVVADGAWRYHYPRHYSRHDPTAWHRRINDPPGQSYVWPGQRLRPHGESGRFAIGASPPMTRKAARVSPPELPPIAGVTLAAEGSTIIVKRHSILDPVKPPRSDRLPDTCVRAALLGLGRPTRARRIRPRACSLQSSVRARRNHCQLRRSATLFVDRPGVTISYPIAIPRDQDRWEGVTSVSDKKINPTWRPTTDILAENSHLPPFVPGWPPTEPARRARALSRKQRLSHPRHGCALDHRHRRLQVALAACFAPGPLPDANTHKVWDLAK